MTIVIDMNLSPAWVNVLARAGYEARHWSTLGSCCATDETIMAWALSHQAVVLTHDLDFGAILASTRACGPSVIQLRTPDPTPSACEHALIGALSRMASLLDQGALISIDTKRSRVHVLPIANRPC